MSITDRIAALEAIANRRAETRAAPAPLFEALSIPEMEWWVELCERGVLAADEQHLADALEEKRLERPEQIPGINARLRDIIRRVRPRYPYDPSIGKVGLDLQPKS